MEHRQQQVRVVIAAIEGAFVSVPRGDITLHEAEVIDVHGTAAERVKARARDRETDWRDVPEDSLEACPNALPFFDPISWRYYLPAFIRCGLRRPAHARSVIDRAIYALDPGDDPSLADYQRERFQTLNAAQTEAVRRFLELAADLDPICDGEVARRALARHWAQW